MKLKKLLAGFMTLAMLVTTLPATAMAAAGEECTGEGCTHVAAIGDTHYADLHDAMTAAEGGETVELLDDVDLSGVEWEPVSFAGKFNGNGYTISNLTINKPGVSSTGFIKSLNGTFKNVTFTNPTVTGGENTGVVAGRAGGSSALAEDITVNGTIKVETTHSGYARAGVIVGGWAYGNYKNITVDGGDKDTSYIKHTGGGDGRYVAGIVGHADDVESYVDCTVKNITISSPNGWLCGGIAGPGPADGLAENCVVENVDINADYSGGMFGWYYGDGDIEDCAVKDVTFTAGGTKNGAIGGYGNNEDANVTNIKIENVKNDDGTPLLSNNIVATIGEVCYPSLQAAIDAAENGDTITLLADAEFATTINTTKDITFDLNNNTLTFKGTDNHFASETKFENGTIDISDLDSEAECIIGIGNYTYDGQMTLDNVIVRGSNLDVPCGVFHLYKDESTLNIIDSTIELANITDENGAAGFVFYVGSGANRDSEIIIDNSTVTVENGVAGFLNGDVTIQNGSEITMTGMTDHGFNAAVSGATLTIDDSTVVIDTEGGRGITVADRDVVIKNGATVTIDAPEGDIVLNKYGVEGTVTIDKSTLNVDTVVDAMDYTDEALSDEEVQSKFIGATTTPTETEGIYDFTGTSTPEEEPTPSKNKTKKYDVIIKNADNGDVEVDDDYAKRGQEITITVDPDKGYELDELTITDQYGDEVDYEEGKKENTFVFDMPKSDVTIEASFDKESSSVADKDDEDKEEVSDKDDEDASAGDGEQEYIRLTIGQKIAWVFDEYVVNDVAPEIKNERTMLPIRFVAEALGATVTWNEAEQKVTITEDDLVIEIFIGQPFATVNGEPVELDAPAYIANDRTYLPLRFVAENLGATVEWNAADSTVTIYE